MATTKTRMYFEGQRLGDGPASPHTSRSRSAGLGFYPGGMAPQSYPLVGVYGFQTQLLVETRLQASDLDFITFQALAADIDGYLEATTVEIENIALVNHDVDSRRLGTVGIVTDDDDVATATAVSTNITGQPFGTVRVEMSSADYTTLDPVIGDMVVINDGDLEAQVSGEIAEVIGVGSFYVEFVARDKDATGSPVYVDASKTWQLRRLEAWWPDCVYRGPRLPRSRTLAEGGFRGSALEYLFETENRMVRRTGVLFVSSAATGPMYGGFARSDRFARYLHSAVTARSRIAYGGRL